MALETVFQSLQKKAMPGALVLERQELTWTLDPALLRSTCAELCQDKALAFAQLLDIVPVDYLSYGQDEWTTEQATRQGFSRGVLPRNGQESKSHFQPPSRFALNYHLLSLTHNTRLRLKVFLDSESPTVDSLSAIWPSANWYEREAFDLFGIEFTGHPDLRRLVTDYDFEHYPLRKDFPLEGFTQTRYNPVQERLITEAVSIQTSPGVPRVIRREWPHE